MTQKRVFLSYSQDDRKLVDRIVAVLQQSGVSTYDIFSIVEPGSSIIDAVRYNIQSSELILFFFSKSFNSSILQQHEFSATLAELKKRKVHIIPIILERNQLPQNMYQFSVIDMTRRVEAGIERLLRKISDEPDISFEQFTGHLFEELVIGMLKAYGFKRIRPPHLPGSGLIDYVADYYQKDPFGVKHKELWLIEIKFYIEDRFSVNTIKEIWEYKRGSLPADSKLLFVTNALLTSAAVSFLSGIQKNENTQIRIINGNDLKPIIANRKRLFKYYSEVVNNVRC